MEYKLLFVIKATFNKLLYEQMFIKSLFHEY